jgi:anoctamin-8
LPETGVLSCLSVIPKVLLAGAITLMDEAYYKLAIWLNDKGENPNMPQAESITANARVSIFRKL